MDFNNSLNSLVHNVVQGGPVGPQRKEPLALLVLNHADPVGRYAVVQKKLLGPAGPKVKEPLALLLLMNNSLTSLVHTVVQGGPAGPQRKERCWFLIMPTLLVGMLSFRRSYWARLAQRLKSHLCCWFFLLASVMLSTTLQVGGFTCTAGTARWWQISGSHFR